MQLADEHSRKLIGLLENKDKLSKQEKSEINGFELYRLHKGRSLLAIPKSMRKGIVIEFFDQPNHHAVHGRLLVFKYTTLRAAVR